MRVVLAVVGVLLTDGGASAIGGRASQGNEATSARLHVEENHTVTLGAEHQNMEVDEWVMEDNSTIVVTRDVCGSELKAWERCTWRIYARRARFGKGTRIVGNGSDGELEGEAGESGIGVDVRMGLVRIGDVNIELRGGDGVDGVRGRHGKSGPRARCWNQGNSPAGRGGAGTDGRRGGDGGGGGSVRVEYWFGGEGVDLEGEGFVVDAAGGNGGAGGGGGLGGAGGRGMWCGFFSYGRGPRGANGRNGDGGRTGAGGAVEITVLAVPVSVAEWRDGLSAGVFALEAGTVFRDCDVCPEMVVVPGRRVALGRYEVTVGEYRAFASATGGGAGGGCRGSWQNPGFRQTDQHPVTCVTWHDAREYVSWLSERTGMAYRLPTEAEWRLAETGTEPGCADARKTCPVGFHGVNGAGVADMFGNVWEWLMDCVEEDCRVRLRNQSTDGVRLVGARSDGRYNTLGGIRVARLAGAP